MAAMPSLAANVDDLLPVDQAFVLSVQPAGAGKIAVQWKITDGYYLYRHRTSVQADAGFTAQALQLPAGEAHDDEFFGRVETYRGRLDATLPGQANAASTVLTIKYQGCADAGICYPPQTRKVTVALPATGDTAGVGSGMSLPNSGGLRSNAIGGGLLGNRGGGFDALPLPAEQAFNFEAIAGDGNTLLLRLTPARGYYLYRDKTSFRLDAAATRAGIGIGQPRWPAGKSHRDEHFGDVTVYFDQIELPLPLLRNRADAATIHLTAGFQGCQTDGICYPPMTRTIELALPRGKVTTPVAPADAGALAVATAASTAQGAPMPGAAPAAPASGDLPNLVQADPAASVASTPAAATTRPTTVAETAESSAAPRGSNLGPLSALLFALLGGLVLNLMPCVLPVLSLKALSLAGNGQDPVRARSGALWYTAGVLLSFMALGAIALGLREAGLALGWGFQLQQPLVVALLALLMFALALSMSGVWHVGGRWTGAGHALTTRHGPAGDFFTGVLAVVVATPCTAPFMGAALAWAFTAPTALGMAVFVALGLGLALPFLLVGFVPALARLLPRPGAWMETLKQLLAFPLYLTAAWLAWVLGRQRGADAIGWWLVAAVLVAFAAWAWTRSHRGSGRWAMPVAVLAVVAMALPLRAIQQLPRPTTTAAAPTHDGLVAVPFSEQKLADLRASGRVVFVNMTADWCVTCKANEKAVFARSGFRDALAAADAVYMVGDWTDVDPALTAYLQRHQAVGVPLYVVYPRAGGDGRVLPTVLTPGLVHAALAEAAGAVP
ncbi:protein-disulfide reductase DsbD family protein [Montanilutibacter psychrotolerans]|uniref:Cytochrome C biogenesis protein n=1 Tax=Montanilutibacter psychrotolerans TaxID=1327343 RepID=A0A3M8SLN7_9GAMM|nr:cytochrome C biogenesis protein [Lysobacter psychrotolerans]